MNLYTVGCSFTQGHRPEEYQENAQYLGNTLINSYDKWPAAWPWLLEKHFEKVINDGKEGTGLNYAIRRLCRFLDFLDNDKLSDWVFVVHVSQAQRLEFLNGNSDHFYMVRPPDIEQAHQGWQGDINNREFMSQFTPYTDLEGDLEYGLWKPQEIHQRYYAVKYFIHTADYEHVYYEHIQKLLCLIHILESLNLKYLITGMFLRDYDPSHIREHVYSQHTLRLINHLPEHNMITDHADLLSKHNAEDSCGHPNEQGHQIIANGVIQEIKNRDWLN